MPFPVPIDRPIPDTVAFAQKGPMSQSVDNFPGLLLAIEQRLGGAAPARQDPGYYRPIERQADRGFIFTPSSSATAARIAPLIPTEEMQQGAEMFVQQAMAETQSQNPDVLRAYLNKALGELLSNPKSYRQ